jgi:two-component system response regulator YesN
MDNGIYALYLAIICILRISCEVYRSKSDDISELDEEKYQIFSFKSDFYHIKNKEELFTYMLTVLNGASNTNSNESDDLNIIDEIVNYVNFNYQYDISLNQLATHKYYMNPIYLSRLFKQVTGKNFSKYVIELRMKKAKELLETDNIKVSEIASYVGYNDLSNFIQTFKKYYNITPSQLRRNTE